MTAKIRRTYAGAAVNAVLTTGVDDNDISIVINPTTGWPSGSYYVVIDPGTASEEKVLVGSRSGSTLTVTTRGVDGTTAKSHSEGAAIYPVAAAIDFDEANELVAAYETTGGVVFKTSSTYDELALGTAGYPLVAGASAPSYAQVTATGIASNAVTTDKINSLAVTTGKIADTAVTTGKIADDAVTQAKIGPSAVGTTELNDSSVTLAKLVTAVQNFLVPVGTISAYPGATAPTGWLLCNGTSTTGYTTLAALVGATTPDLRGHTLVGKGSAPFDGTLLSKLGSTTSTAAHSHTIGHDHGPFTSGDDSPDHDHGYLMPAYGTNPIINEADTSTGYSFVGSPNITGGARQRHQHSVDVPAFSGDSGPSSAGSTHGNVQPSALVNYIIKHD
jgi:microcystin-dependent protein